MVELSEEALMVLHNQCGSNHNFAKRIVFLRTLLKQNILERGVWEKVKKDFRTSFDGAMHQSRGGSLYRVSKSLTWGAFMLNF